MRTALILAFAALLALTACGKKGDPKPPPTAAELEAEKKTDE
ncbi:MAG: LPS translocon maturation chaperone LptM [Minwuia sp.]